MKMEILRKIVAACLIIFCLTLCHAENISKGAIIMTGDGFHSYGLEMEAELLKKSYDVHLVQFKNDTQLVMPDFPRPNSKLVEQLNGKHYEKLLFIVYGHGNEYTGLSIAWEKMLVLVKCLEIIADELFVHLHTCHSGDIVQQWNKELSEKVKVFNTLSCKGKNGTAFVLKPSFVQFITGYWYHDPNRRQVNVEAFKNLRCDATLSDIANAVDTTTCGFWKATCYKTHVHRGGYVKLKEWNLLPIMLVKKSDGFNGDHEEIPFAQSTCHDGSKKFTETREINIKKNTLIHTYTSIFFDPTHTIKIQNVNRNGEAKDAPDELKNAPPYSTVLSINSKKCDTQNGCKPHTAYAEMSNIRSINIGYHRNKNKLLWITPNGETYPTFSWDQDYPDDPPYIPGPEPVNNDPQSSYEYNYVPLVICIFAALALISCGVAAYFCCRVKKNNPQPLNYNVYNPDFPNSQNTNPPQRQSTA